MTPKQKSEFINLLLACPLMQERAQRDIVVQELPFADKIKRHSADRFDVVSIFNVCLAYPNGIETLLDSMTLFEGDSWPLAFQALLAKWAEFQTPPPPPVITPPTIIPPTIIPPRPKIAFDWVTIPEGSFIMGSNDYDSEKPAHEIYLPEYYAARVPVTNEQWVIFLKESGYHWTGLDNWWQWIHQNKSGQEIHVVGKANSLRLTPGKEQHPVDCVSWYDAMIFCDWANSLNPSPSPSPIGRGEKVGEGYVIRLPTEAEWEKASRGTDGRKYPWGNHPPTDQLCNFNHNINYTTPVGAYPKGASPYGVLDMAGTVWEWCSSSYKPYPYRVDDGRESRNSSDYKIFRGGSWDYDAVNLRCACRYKIPPFNPSYYIGLRCFVVPIF